MGEREPSPCGALADALRVLTHRQSDIGLGSEREWAARVLLAEMEHWAPRTIWKALSRELKRLAPEDVESLIADAVQALALAASTTSQGFRGESELSARAWCRKVLLSHVQSELRRRRVRNAFETAELDSRALDPAVSVDEGGRDVEPVASDLADALRLLREIRRSVYVLHRPRDAESIMRAVWCYLSYLSGATLEEQVRSLRELSERGSSESDTKRFRNRIYKLRERGRKALSQVFGVIVGA